jgi:pyruvate kinase
MAWIDLFLRLKTILSHLLEAEARSQSLIERARPESRASTRNLIHYLALRQLDVRKTQLELADCGLSSLGRSEGAVLGNLLRVIERVSEAQGRVSEPTPALETLTFAEAEQLLHQHTRDVFGPKPKDRHVYIMVTAPDRREGSETFFDRLVASGVDILRINTAHGQREDWQTLVSRARAAARRAGHDLRVLVDLPGPKLRTEALAPPLQVLKMQPRRDELGKVVEPFQLRLLRPGQSIESELSVVLPEPFFDDLQDGDRLLFRDARGRSRKLTVEARPHGQWLACGQQTAYLTPQQPIRCRGAHGAERGPFLALGLPRCLPSVELPVGENFLLIHPNATSALPSNMPCFAVTVGEVFETLAVGQRIFVDDGKIETRVIEAAPHFAVLQVVRAVRNRARLRGEQGLNLPDTEVKISAISEPDREAFAFAKDHADLVGVSFVRSVQDVEDLENLIHDTDLGLVVKVETRGGFDALPTILLRALGRRPLAVMIARGDLAVECGYERLAEIQEEILWLCEAAHTPVVWATQVLENLAKTGFPTRAEVTDAAMSVRAECVMLNKGPFIMEAVELLANILQRMEAHTFKKRSLYRPLAVSGLGHLNLQELAGI